MKEIKGQNKIIELLEMMIKGGSLPHAMIFTGLEGVGKSLVAQWLARRLNCASGDDVCDNEGGGCLSCRKIDKGIHPDVMTYRPEGGWIKIEHVRNIQSNMAFAPLEGRWRVIIVEDAHRMNVYASNAFLKCLEEPPLRNIIILVTHNINAVLPTVRSRSHRFLFPPLNGEIVADLLKMEGINDEEIGYLARVSRGSMSRSLKIRKELFEGELKGLKDNFLNVMKGDLGSLFEYSRKLIEMVRSKDSTRTRERLKDFIELIKYECHESVGHSIDKGMSDGDLQKERDVRRSLYDIFERLNRAQNELDANANPALCIDAALIDAHMTLNSSERRINTRPLKD